MVCFEREYGVVEIEGLIEFTSYNKVFIILSSRRHGVPRPHTDTLYTRSARAHLPTTYKVVPRGGVSLSLHLPSAAGASDQRPTMAKLHHLLPRSRPDHRREAARERSFFTSPLAPRR